MGDLPDWYVLIRAARYFNVAPWELAAQPIIWVEYALSAEKAEYDAGEQIRKRGGSGDKSHSTKPRRK